MGKFLKTATVALVTGAGLAYFLKTEKGQKTLSKTLETGKDLLDNPELIKEKVEDSLHCVKESCTVEAISSLIETHRLHAKTILSDLKSHYSDVSLEEKEFDVHVDDITIDYDEDK